MTMRGKRSGKEAVNKRNARKRSRRGRRIGRDRAIRLAFLRTLRDLRLSIAARRPMSLPNCIRLCRRRLGAGRAKDPAVLKSLTSIYRKHQPFRRGPHVIRVR
jgi:hypothetical protein